MKIPNSVVEGLCWAGGFVLLFLACLGILGLLLALLAAIVNVFAWVPWQLVFGGAFLWAALMFCFLVFSDNTRVQAVYKRCKESDSGQADSQ